MDPVLFSAPPEDWGLGVPVQVPKPLQTWAVETALVDSETEELLHAVDPNDVFPSHGVAESSESDSGISEETLLHRADQGPHQGPDQDRDSGAPQTPVFQLVYDVGDSALNQHNIISIELDPWSQLLLSEQLLSGSCVVNELLSGSSEPLEQGLELQLTEEEQKLLNQEGVRLPNDAPLTKAEEKILRKVRRKIRNKQSAQDSRRRKKEYVDELENRAAQCSAQNQELQRKVEQLEKNNMSLMSQLCQLQNLIKKTVSKGAQTSTCLLIIVVSLGLILLPSFSPFVRRSAAGDDYRPSGVISRNILTDPASSQPAVNEDAVPDPELSDLVQSQSQNSPAAVDQSEPSTEPTESQTNQSDQSADPDARQIAGLSANETITKEKRDSAKPVHADEM